jgi:peptidoglycan/LPS O-acetylase OafA/YrhL
MTTITAATDTTVRTDTDAAVATTSRRLPLLRTGLAAGAVAAVATTLVVAVARGFDVAVAVDGEAIPLLGFAQLTLVGALIGVALARVFTTRARHPQRTFTITTVALTAVSIIPDVLVDATTGSRFVLALTHVVAAAIVIPALAHRLPR